MRNTITGLFLAVGIFGSAQACEISPTIKMQFCVDVYKLAPDQKAEVAIEGIPSTDFEVRPVLGTMKVVYKGKITDNKKGKILVKDKNGTVIAERNISLITKDYAEGYDKVMKGTATLLKELRQ